MCVCVCWVVQRGAGGCQIRRGVSSEVSAFRGGSSRPCPRRFMCVLAFSYASIRAAFKPMQFRFACVAHSLLSGSEAGGEKRERLVRHPIPSRPSHMLCVIRSMIYSIHWGYASTIFRCFIRHRRSPDRGDMALSGLNPRDRRFDLNTLPRGECLVRGLHLTPRRESPPPATPQ